MSLGEGLQVRGERVGARWEEGWRGYRSRLALWKALAGLEPLELRSVGLEIGPIERAAPDDVVVLEPCGRGTARVVGFVVGAASTVGTFPRSFRWGHIHQVDRGQPGAAIPGLGMPVSSSTSAFVSDWPFSDCQFARA